MSDNVALFAALEHSMTAAALTGRHFVHSGFRVGRAVNQALTVLSRNFVSFGALALLWALPNALFQRLEGADSEVASLLGLAILTLLAFALGALASAAIAHGTFEILCGRSAGTLALLHFGMRRFLPFMGVSTVCFVVSMLGFIAFNVPRLTVLIVPDLMALTAWYVAPTICAIEGTGPIASLKRSDALTKGYRWKIFGVGLFF